MTKFISEIASAHTGKISLIKKISNLHCGSNSNFLKLQIFKTKNLFQKSNKKYTNFKKLEISFKSWFEIINQYKNKTKIILEPFDNESYKFCKKFKNQVYIKISSSESDNIELILDALTNFKKVFINLSGMDLSDIKKILFFLKKKKLKKKVILMYGFQAYPTRAGDLRFGLFRYFKKLGFDYGYADHSTYGINNDVINVCAFAKKKIKCKFIEKHVCYDLSKKPNDFITSININDMNLLIKKINRQKKFKKFPFKKNISINEKSYFLNFIKFAYVRKDISSGSKINIEDLIFLRSSSKKKGITRLNLIGKKFIAKNLIKKNEQLYHSDIK